MAGGGNVERGVSKSADERDTKSCIRGEKADEFVSAPVVPNFKAALKCALIEPHLG